MFGKYPILKIFLSLGPPPLILPLLLLLVVVFCENPCLADIGAIRTAIIITAAKVIANFSFNFIIYAHKIFRWLNIIAVKGAINQYYMQGLIQKLSSMMWNSNLYKSKQQEENHFVIGRNSMIRP